jgi:hypothetical protein
MDVAAKQRPSPGEKRSTTTEGSAGRQRHSKTATVIVPNNEELKLSALFSELAGRTLA